MAEAEWLPPDVHGAADKGAQREEWMQEGLEHIKDKT